MITTIVLVLSFVIALVMIRIKWHDVTSYDRFVAITTWSLLTLITLILAGGL